MSGCVLDVAVAQLREMDAPTAIVPVSVGDEAGVFYATYVGDAEWMASAREELDQAELAIACCARAHRDALDQVTRRHGGGDTR